MAKWVLMVLLLISAHQSTPSNGGTVALYQRDATEVQFRDCVPIDRRDAERYRTMIFVYGPGWTLAWECDTARETEPSNPTPTPDPKRIYGRQ